MHFIQITKNWYLNYKNVHIPTLRIWTWTIIVHQWRTEASMKYARHWLIPLQWRHNGRDSVSNHQPRDCLLNRTFRRRSNKHQSSAPLAFVRGIHRWPVNSPQKWPVTQKRFPFDDVIMQCCWALADHMSIYHELKQTSDLLDHI